ncbi:hypothetical protein ABZ897_37580 [Nonomuraea sp. NPDC046802]|uniref:hypothetical protein n=1 Tax=Nonomuraea sp. NPDC046802 TaxID=3154919 RepID=UPI0033F08FCE
MKINDIRFFRICRWADSAATRSPAVYAEAGAWRARLDELLDTRPATAILTRLIDETVARLPP